VYSWVPDEVQEAILAACGRLLSPSGVAYVGYNTYPGWKAKEIVSPSTGVANGSLNLVDSERLLICYRLHSVRTLPAQSHTKSAL
jgi:hypothetical protein